MWSWFRTKSRRAVQAFQGDRCPIGSVARGDGPKAAWGCGSFWVTTIAGWSGQSSDERHER
jgi:hypothetical protein